MYKIYGKLLSLLILYSLRGSICQDISDLKSLRTQLFTTNDYDKRFRPLKNQSQVVDVIVGLEVIKLNEINDIEETMTITAYIRVQWTDEELTWTPSSYGNIGTIFFPQEDIWTPDIAIKNSYGESTSIGFDTLNTKISSYGDVYWAPHQQCVSTCSLNVREYPFDEQNCELILTSWSYNRFQMVFSNASTISISDYEESPSWTLKSTSVEIRTSVSFLPEIVYTLSLQRKPTYIVLTVICPIIVLVVLDLFVFLVPASSGEKSGYAVTVFLSLAVFLTIIESSIPSNAETVPYFTLYVIILVFLSTAITLLSIVLVKCLTYDDRNVPVPKILIKLARLFRCKQCRKTITKVEDLNEKMERKEKGTPDKEKGQSKCQIEENEPNWADIVNSFDRFLFILFTIIFILISIIFLLIMMT